MKNIILAIACLLIIAGQAHADVTLSWTAPTENADGSKLNDLAGFKIYEVINGAYNEVADVPKDSTTATVTLGEGDRCFVGTAYDTSGNESKYTNESCKDTLPPATYILTIH